jgi:hypothetical protein
MRRSIWILLLGFALGCLAGSICRTPAAKAEQRTCVAGVYWPSNIKSRIVLIWSDGTTSIADREIP